MGHELWTMAYDRPVSKDFIWDLIKDGNVWTNQNYENVVNQNAVFLVKMKIGGNQNPIMDFLRCGDRENA